MKKAIVTITIGDKYESLFINYCKKNWEKYCQKFNYDLIVINNSLDITKRAKERSPAWQKLLILSQEWSKNYDQIVWIDSDVIINYEIAKDIASLVEKQNFGAADAYSIPTKETYNLSLQRQYKNWKRKGIDYIENLRADEYYKNRGIYPSKSLNSVVQTGVFVSSPKDHREIFEHIYYSYEDLTKKPSWNYEMPAMSYELLKSNIVQWIPNEFNYCVLDIISAFYPFIFFQGNPSIRKKIISKLFHKIGIDINIKSLTPIQINCLSQIYSNGYFIHFAGCQDWIREIM